MEKEYMLKLVLPEGHEIFHLEIESILYMALRKKLKEDGVSDEILKDWKNLNVDVVRCL